MSESASTSGSLDECTPAAKRQRTLARDWKVIDSQGSFKEEWRKQFLVIPHPTNNSQCLCLVCRTHTIKRHFESKLTELPTDAKVSRYKRLLAAYEKERHSIVASTNTGRKQMLATLDHLPEKASLFSC